MNDPEMMAALQNPKVMAAFTAVQQNPAKIMEYMSDPDVGPVLQKLIVSTVCFDYCNGKWTWTLLYSRILFDYSPRWEAELVCPAEWAECLVEVLTMMGFRTLMKTKTLI